MERLTDKDTVASIKYNVLKIGAAIEKVIDLLEQCEDTGMTPTEIVAFRAMVKASLDNPAIMTSPIGDLTIDTTGMRTAVDKIVELQKENAKWIKFETEIDKDNGKEIFTCPVPDDEQEILITDGKNVWLDTFCNDGCECYFDSGFDFDKITHWRPLPKPPEESEER